jgi:hypothetical protein
VKHGWASCAIFRRIAFHVKRVIHTICPFHVKHAGWSRLSSFPGLCREIWAQKDPAERSRRAFIVWTHDFTAAPRLTPDP